MYFHVIFQVKGISGYVWGVHGCVRVVLVCTGVSRCASVCTGVHGCAWVCASVRGCAWVCMCVCRLAWVWVGVQVYALVCACVLDEFSEFLLENRVPTSVD